MIDYFALALTHGLLALACWRILLRSELDVEPAKAPRAEPDPPTKAPRHA